MENTSGFYKQNEEGEWMFAPNFVFSADYELTRKGKDEHTYPIGGWYWFDESPVVSEETMPNE